MRLGYMWDLRFTQLSCRRSCCFGCYVPGERLLLRLWIYSNHNQAAHVTRVLLDSEDDATTTFRKVCKY
jgi:hypothetical protein